MKAIGFTKSLPIEEAQSFELFEVDKPRAQGRDLLVKIAAIAMNPVDYKIRQSAAVDERLADPKILGWDACGTVEAVGESCSLFKEGDLVYYAGDLTRPGCNQEYQLVDERIVGFAPQHIPVDAAAAMPLTSLTAWELLFDRLQLTKEKDAGKKILIIGGAGGVGSMAIQIAKNLLGLEVITTASREASISWCEKMGADQVVNHRDLLNEMKKAGHDPVDYILDLVDVNQYWEAMCDLIKPQGKIGSISDPAEPVQLRDLKAKSVSFHWELMYTRSMFQTADMQRQHQILNKVAALLDSGELQSTLKQTLRGLTVANLKAAHQTSEAGTMIGKLAIEF
ncbi:zinc-binding alcohol dehydrogenase family protein [Persicobacter diffluens]|uniref:Zinc-type alcohol dehydrogenase-like protein n=1 Tax=Persicobacter diffluens TaxID=981 RepID=A0AAN5AN84_9BACT|nr:NADPH:quinone reductase [Persicobacter diffluens]